MMNVPERAPDKTESVEGFYVETWGEVVRLTSTCFVTEKDYSVVVSRAEYVRRFFIDGKLPQSLSLEDREFLISKTSPEGWKQIFPGTEEA